MAKKLKNTIIPERTYYENSAGPRTFTGYEDGTKNYDTEITGP